MCSAKSERKQKKVEEGLQIIVKQKINADNMDSIEFIVNEIVRGINWKGETDMWWDGLVMVQEDPVKPAKSLRSHSIRNEWHINSIDKHYRYY